MKLVIVESPTKASTIKRYLGNDYSLNIGYILNGKHEDLYVFYVGDLLVIQVGLSDEGPKFIAYEKIDNVILDSEYESE